jgi:ABC-type phosphate transport system substrate-binding protein
MSKQRMSKRKLRGFAGSVLRATAALALVALGLTAAPTPAGATNYVSVSGSGSSWAGIAINQWISNVGQNGLTVNYNPDGSGTGRDEFIQNQDDFTGSDPPFRSGGDGLAGTAPEVVPYNYSYIPDVAGGTAFMYHLDVGGHQITNLRLDGEILMKIFTNQITNWDDKAITKSYGAQLPNIPIVPVIRSDYSGATYFFTRWMAHMWPSQWNSFCTRVHPGIKLPCPQTELYPQFGSAKAENGSNNVAAYITSSFANGAIGYDEYAYALNSHFPVVKLLNPAGYYVLPTKYNVSVALTKAVINSDKSSVNYLQQNLDNVYTFKDPRSYPLSSYSYFIVPRVPKPPPVFSSPSGKGVSLSTFINYMLCAGQQNVGQLGYAPLPVGLVRGGFFQDAHIPNHGPIPSLSTLPQCHNPTFINGQDTLLKNAPFPSPCDKLGAPLTCVVKNGKPTTPGKGGNSPSAGPSSTATGPAGVGTGTGTGTTTGGDSGGPVTGQVVNVAANEASTTTLGVLTALAILVAVTVPPFVALWLRRRRGQANG